ncbi:MAG: NfeD family protein [Planctomycetota bacterium]
MNAAWLIFAVFLFLTCAVLLVVEVFVPSLGLLTLCALGAAAGGIAIFFNHSQAAGWGGVVVAVIMIPAVWIITYRLFPKTRFGKNVTLRMPVREKGDGVPDTPELKRLLGSVGVVVTPLRPVGTCDFSGQRVECVAESGYIESNETVRVIRVEGTQLTVRLQKNEN